MATWNDLTQAQQTQFSVWMDQLLRPVAGELARVLYHLELTKTAYGVSAQDIYNLLDADAIIPNTSGLSGAIPLEKQELTPMLAALNSILADYYSQDSKDLYISLAGAPNVLG